MHQCVAASCRRKKPAFLLLHFKSSHQIRDNNLDTTAIATAQRAMKHDSPIRRGIKKVRAAVGSPFRRDSKRTCITHHPYLTGNISSPGSFAEINSNHSVTTFDPSDSDTDSTMGKSNKFDFTNRPNSGVKLGGIIGRDLEKEADKAQKDAEKQAAKARKQSSSSVVSSQSSSPGDVVIHHLDIKIPSKQLGDEGAIAMADGLKRALEKGTFTAGVALEDLNLSDNAITTATLERLAPAIKLACHDVKTLNLSNNAIKVANDEEARQWQTFLRSFGDCRKMRRLDLSGNPLGSRALEILAQVYTREPPIEHMSASGDRSVVSLSSHEDGEEPESGDLPEASGMIDGQHLKRRCGLRAIPYITLNNIGLDEAGALWLSYILEEHPFPCQLINLINASSPSSPIGTYVQGGHKPQGIDWENEPDVGRDGFYLLGRAEAVREQVMLADQFSINDSEVGTADTGGDASKRMHERRASRGDRRASIRSVLTVDGEQEQSELETARKKVQRAVIQKHGACSVELWQTSLRITLAARVLTAIGPKVRGGVYTGPPLFDHKASSRPVTPANRITGGARTSPTGTMRQGTYAATLTANTDAVAGEPLVAITEVTNTPTTPKMVFKAHRKGGMSEGSDGIDPEEVAQKLQKLHLSVKRDDNPERFVKYQEGSWKHRLDQRNGPDRSYRDTTVASQLPANIMETIALNSVDLWAQRLLTEKQRKRCVEWGLQRNNFVVEKEWHKMADSAQVVMLLERTGCLAHQQE
ncbi:uncharacterized protein CLAFUR5_06492 [Fulvia fulva]|uniref:Uncharacterized protein n=1 Tax=Passalora fulva TaxID=5499 RepID=A0A9Q8LJD2_PASFU|nr:uncharacterized protein CLAFUR5_06492 [Fulvia fulva]UJO17678.1 hypothetical protein CLAFUR5_06492 [Fulvia fulva]WPV30322.1 hypothetical protein CLAFUW7_06346 [Fulvia fulva]